MKLRLVLRSVWGDVVAYPGPVTRLEVPWSPAFARRFGPFPDGEVQVMPRGTATRIGPIVVVDAALTPDERAALVRWAVSLRRLEPVEWCETP